MTTLLIIFLLGVVVYAFSRGHRTPQQRRAIRRRIGCDC
jgi:cbb3-type cytochrome oxidase subunit 3